MANQSKLKAWVRYDGTGRVISGGPIFQVNKPKVGNWKQIDANLCCNGTTPTTTTTTTSGGGGTTPTAWVVRFFLNEQNACAYMFSNSAIGYTSTNFIGGGTTIWADAGLTIPFSTQGYGIVKFEGDNNIYTIGSLGQFSPTVITGIVSCTTTTTTTTAPVYKSFAFNGTITTLPADSCSSGNVFTLTNYFIGAGTYPAIGDTVYYFSAGQYIPVTQNGGYTKMANYSVFSTNAQGVVVDVVNCLKSFTDTNTASGGSATACAQPDTFPATHYFIGAGNYPAVGDPLYLLSQNGYYLPLVNGSGGNYTKMSNNSAYATNTEGVVVDIVSC